MSSTSKLVREVHRRQATRHVIANKLQLALTVLRELENEKVVQPKLIKRAAFDLKVILRFLDRQNSREHS